MESDNETPETMEDEEQEDVMVDDSQETITNFNEIPSGIQRLYDLPKESDRDVLKPLENITKDKNPTSCYDFSEDTYAVNNQNDAEVPNSDCDDYDHMETETVNENGGCEFFSITNPINKENEIDESNSDWDDTCSIISTEEEVPDNVQVSLIPTKEDSDLEGYHQILCKLFRVNSIYDIQSYDGSSIFANAGRKELSEILRKFGLNDVLNLNRIKKSQKKIESKCDIAKKSLELFKILKLKSISDFRSCATIAMYSSDNIYNIRVLLKECEKAWIAGRPNFSNELRAAAHFIQHGHALGYSSATAYINGARSSYGEGKMDVRFQDNGKKTVMFTTHNTKSVFFVDENGIIIGTFHRENKPNKARTLRV